MKGRMDCFICAMNQQLDPMYTQLKVRVIEVSGAYFQINVYRIAA